MEPQAATQLQAQPQMQMMVPMVVWNDQAAVAQWQEMAWQLDVVNKIGGLFQQLQQKFAPGNFCLCQAWMGMSETNSPANQANPQADVMLYAEPNLVILGDSYFEELRSKSCQGPVGFRNSMPGKVFKTGAVQVIQNMKIIPPSLHPRSLIGDEALERMAEALYVPVYDASRPARGPVAVIEVLFSLKAGLVADFISFVSTALSLFQLSLSNPIPQPIKRSVLSGRRARPVDSETEMCSSGNTINALHAQAVQERQAAAGAPGPGPSRMAPQSAGGGSASGAGAMAAAPGSGAAQGAPTGGAQQLVLLRAGSSSQPGVPSTCVPEPQQPSQFPQQPVCSGTSSLQPAQAGAVAAAAPTSSLPASAQAPLGPRPAASSAQNGAEQEEQGRLRTSEAAAAAAVAAAPQGCHHGHPGQPDAGAPAPALASPKPPCPSSDQDGDALAALPGAPDAELAAALAASSSCCRFVGSRPGSTAGSSGGQYQHHTALLGSIGTDAAAAGAGGQGADDAAGRRGHGQQPAATPAGVLQPSFVLLASAGAAGAAGTAQPMTAPAVVAAGEPLAAAAAGGNPASTGRVSWASESEGGHAGALPPPSCSPGQQQQHQPYTSPFAQPGQQQQQQRVCGNASASPSLRRGSASRDEDGDDEDEASRASKRARREGSLQRSQSLHVMKHALLQGGAPQGSRLSGERLAQRSHGDDDDGDDGLGSDSDA